MCCVSARQHCQVFAVLDEEIEDGNVCPHILSIHPVRDTQTGLRKVIRFDEGYTGGNGLEFRTVHHACILSDRSPKKCMVEE